MNDSSQYNDENEKSPTSSQLINQLDEKNLRKFLNGQKNMFKQEHNTFNSGIVDLLFNLFNRIVDMIQMTSNNSTTVTQLSKAKLTQAKSLFHKEINSFMSYYGITSNLREIIHNTSFSINSIKSEPKEKDNERIRLEISNNNIIDKIKQKMRNKRLCSIDSNEKDRSLSQNKSINYTPNKTEQSSKKKASQISKTASYSNINNNSRLFSISYNPATTEWKNSSGEKSKKDVKPSIYTRKLMTKYQKVIDNYDQILGKSDNKRKSSQNSSN